MHVTTALAGALLAILSQTTTTPTTPSDPSPPPVTSQTPPPGAGIDPGAAPAPEQAPVTTMPQGMPPPAADQVSTTSATGADVWRVEQVEVPGAAGQPARRETRVLRGDGTAVTVGEGLASINQTNRLAARARAADTSETSTQAIVGRATILGASGALTVVGLAVAAFGGGVWAYSRLINPTATDQLAALAPTAPSILVTGLIAAGIGLFALIVSGALWAWVLWRGAPPADPSVVQALGAALAWDEREASEVVDRHNATVQAPAPETTPSPSLQNGQTAPSPGTESMPPPAMQDTQQPPPPAPSTGTPNP